MKKFKLLPLIFATLFFCGCSLLRSSPADDLTLILQIVMYGDEDAMDRLNVSQAEYQSLFIDGIMKEFDNSNVKISETQKRKFVTSLQNLLSRTNFYIEDISEDEDKATVAVTVDVFQKIEEDDLLTQFFSQLSLGMLFYNVEGQMANTVLQVLADTMDHLPAVGSETFYVDCFYDYDKEMWLPVDGNELGQKIFSTMFSKSFSNNQSDMKKKDVHDL